MLGQPLLDPLFHLDNGIALHSDPTESGVSITTNKSTSLSGPGSP